jgi:hypothetical protein
MTARQLTTTLSILTLLLASPGPAAARSLSKKLHTFISNVTTPIEANVVEPVTPIVKRMGVRGADVPTTATTPGYTYHYNPDLGVFERSESLGPLFLERADTVGKGHFDVGFSYVYADLTDVGGINFGERIQLGSQITASDTDGNPVDVAGVFLGNDFSLQHHVFSFAGTYGITNNWDVNLVLPLMYTILDLRGDAGVAIGPDTIASGPVSFNNFFGNDAFGIGDMLMRTKYRILQSNVANLAATFELRLPTGDKDDFQGLGDVTMTPALVASRHFGRLGIHGMGGFEVNGDDLERNRAHYGIGLAWQAIKQLAVLVDVFGSSSFTDDDFDIPKSGGIVPDFNLLPSDFIKRETSTKIVAFVPQSNIVDVAVSLKYNVFGNAVAFVGAVVPLTNDGLRTSTAMPTGGFEWTF